MISGKEIMFGRLAESNLVDKKEACWDVSESTSLLFFLR